MPLDHKLLTTKFEGLKNKQDKIQVLSLFLIHNRKHVSSITDVWFKVVKKSPADHRLTLLYLANDVVQHAKKKGHVALVEGFQKAISESVPYLSDPNIKPAVSRVFSIWAERSVYPVAFIVDLKKKLGEGNPLKESAITAKIVAEYKLSSLLDSIKWVQNVEKEVETKTNLVTGSNITKLSNEILAGIKDKSVAEELTQEFEAASVLLVDAISSLEKEITEKRKLLDELSKSLVYYVIQGKEVEQLTAAYRKLGANVALIKKRKSGRKDLADVSSLIKDVPSPSESDDGPVLPSDSATPVKSDPAPVSSLDQRLTLLMQGALDSGVAPPQSINPNFRQPTAAATPTKCEHPPLPPPAAGSQFQTIQSVITPRTDQDLIQPTDMDITNSDEEDLSEQYAPLAPPSRAINPGNMIPLNVPNRGNFSNNNQGSMIYPPPQMHRPPPPIPRSVVVPTNNSIISGGHHRPPPNIMSHVPHHMDHPPMDHRSNHGSWPPPPQPLSREIENRHSRGPRPPTPERISRMVSQYRSASSTVTGRQPSSNNSRREGW